MPNSNWTIITAILFSVGLGLLPSLAASTALVVGAYAVARMGKAIGIEPTFLSGLVIFVLGIVPTISFAVVLMGGIHSVSSRLTVLVLLVGLVWAAIKSREVSVRTNRDVFPVVALIAVLSLVGKMWFFLVPLLVGLGLCTLLAWMRTKRVGGRFSALLGALSTASILGGSFWSSILARTSWAEGAIFRTPDQYFRTSVGIGTTSFGVNDNMGAAGMPMRYHWLSETFVVLWGRFIGSSPVDAVVRLSPVIGSLITVALVYVIVKRWGGGTIEAFLGATVLTTLSVLLYSQGINILKTTEMGQFWGTPLFLFGLLILLAVINVKNTPSILVLVFWYPVLVMTNSTLGITYACGTGAVLLVGFVRRRVRASTFVIVTGGMLITLLVLRETLLAPLSFKAFSPEIRFDDPFGFGIAFGYMGTNGVEKVLTGLALIAVMWVQGGATLGLRRSGTQDSIRSQLALFGFAAVVPVFFISILDGFERYRFLNPIMIVGPISLALSAKEIGIFMRSANVFVRWTLLIAGIWLGLQSDVMEKTFGGFDVILPRVIYSSAVIAIPMIFVLALNLGPRLMRKKRRGSLSVNQVRAAGVFGTFSLALLLTSFLTMMPGQIRYASSLTGPTVGNLSRIACLNYVRSNTDRSSVVASYMWRYGDDPMTEKWFLVSAVSERRAFVDGPIYVENPQGEWLKLRQDITTRFVEEAPNASDSELMRRAGVEYFVVDTRWTDRQSWLPHAERVFSNSDCIVLRLVE